MGEILLHIKTKCIPVSSLTLDFVAVKSSLKDFNPNLGVEGEGVILPPQLVFP